ncbi:conserved hypothetical protein [Hyphomicrobiales bacterium]|nr:conserved hypothetical protein [Hyphomicrobiales bacterium]CAH1691950.1 conserved hypothetical protein [Hyphomicrobiales bacterium]
MRYQGCLTCGRAQFPPSVICVHCHSDILEWRTSSGRGRIYSLTQVWRAPIPAMAAAVPYYIALIDLEEGFRIMVNIRSQPEDRVEIGAPVIVVYETADDVSLPQAKLDPE